MTNKQAWLNTLLGICQVFHLVADPSIWTLLYFRERIAVFLPQLPQCLKSSLSMKWPRPRDVCCPSVLVRTFGFYKSLPRFVSHTHMRMHTHTGVPAADVKVSQCIPEPKYLAATTSSRERHSDLLQGWEGNHMLSHTQSLADSHTYAHTSTNMLLLYTTTWNVHHLQGQEDNTFKTLTLFIT